MSVTEDGQILNVLMIAPRDIWREFAKDYTAMRFPSYLALRQHLFEMVSGCPLEPWENAEPQIDFARKVNDGRLARCT